MKDLLIKLVQRQKDELTQIVARLNVLRDSVESLQAALKSPLIKVIMGPRRAGKSSLAVQALSGSSFSYFNFEDELLPTQLDGDQLIEALLAVYGKTEFVFFDEIQNMSNWEVMINRLHRLGFNIVVTGSNSKLLSQEFSSSLTGRHLAFTLLPFSFSEFCRAKSQDHFENQLIMDYLRFGGFPEVATGRVESSGYLKDLFESIFVRDIVQRFKIRNISAIRELLKLYVASVGSRFSGRSLERGLRGQCSIATVQKYLRYSKEAYLVQDLESFSLSTRKRLASDRKAYVIDNGFYSKIHFSIGDNIGVLLENAVFIELLRRGAVANQNLFYFSSADPPAFEVDFFLSDSLELIQVSAYLSSEQTKNREFKALLKAAKMTGAKKLKVVTLGERDVIRENGFEIEVLPVVSWLKGE